MKLFFFSSSQFITNFADGLFVIVLTLLISNNTSFSSSYLGIILGTLSLPWILFSIPSGIMIDKFKAHRIAILANLFRSILVILFFLFIHISVSIIILVIITFSIGIFEVLCDNSHSTMLPFLVERNKLEHMNSILTTGELISNKFLGVYVGSILLGISSLFAISINSFLFFTSSMLIILTYFKSPQLRRYIIHGYNYSTKKPKSRFFDIFYLFKEKNLLLIILMGSSCNLSYGIQQSYLIYYVNQNLLSSNKTVAR